MYVYIYTYIYIHIKWLILASWINLPENTTNKTVVTIFCKKCQIWWYTKLSTQQNA